MPRRQLQNWRWGCGCSSADESRCSLTSMRGTRPLRSKQLPTLAAPLVRGRASFALRADACSTRAKVRSVSLSGWWPPASTRPSVRGSNATKSHRPHAGGRRSWIFWSSTSQKASLRGRLFGWLMPAATRVFARRERAAEPAGPGLPGACTQRARGSRMHRARAGRPRRRRSVAVPSPQRRLRLLLFQALLRGPA